MEKDTSPKMKMPKDKYLQIQMAVISIGRMTSTLDLDAFLEQIKDTETFGASLPPEMYQAAHANLSIIKKLVESLLPVKVAFNDLFKAATKMELNAKVEKHLNLAKKENAKIPRP